jgi:hypothetical protein
MSQTDNLTPPILGLITRTVSKTLRCLCHLEHKKTLRCISNKYCAYKIYSNMDNYVEPPW